LKNIPFYAGGRCFSCRRCSSCCRIDPGFVFLSKNDAGLLAQQQKMDYNLFIETFCRWVPAEDGGELLSLKELPNYDCIFWDSGCTVYESRPLQCRTFPFWPKLLQSPEAWDSAKQGCLGMDQGEFHSFSEIEAIAASMQRAEIISRRGF
jgi:Fe-S-cluster containining protein